MSDARLVQDICGRLDRGEIDRDQFFEQLTRAVADLIGCTRAGVWVIVDTEQGRALRCMATYDRRVDRIVLADDMPAAAFGPYFHTLVNEGCVVAPDARHHPATSGFLDSYLVPQDIHSLLDVCFSVNGVPVGAFCCEQVGAACAWSQRQVQLLRQIGSRASLALLHAANAEADTRPAALWEPTSPNRLLTRPAALEPAPPEERRRDPS